MPGHRASFQVDGIERLGYWFGSDLRRPFWFPVMGPAGRPVTRMGHPHDPAGHSHHNSVWVSHMDVNGVDFWADFGEGRITHEGIDRYEDGSESAAMSVRNIWRDSGGRPLLKEWRRTEVRPVSNDDWWMLVELVLEPSVGDVTFGKTPFGLFAVRVAKTMGVRDGGGRVRNSEGGINEKGVFWKPARWVDYSGPVTASRRNGITLMDHPGNPGCPSVYHVRDDGWMGVSFTYGAPYVLKTGQRLQLLYGLWVHDDEPSCETIEQQYRRYAGFKPTSRPANPK